jgi:uncharacterized YigZ family protein
LQEVACGINLYFSVPLSRMEATSYRTLATASQGQYKEKGSRFLAFAYPVSNIEEIKQQLEALRKEYYDARHHCYAWMLGADKTAYRANDDGEPNHSAGDPILGQLKSHDLTDVLIVVVRYFGGTKLGVGGLITAYKTAAQEALRQSVIVEKPVTKNVELFFPYEATPEVMRLVKQSELSILEQSFDEQSRLTCALPARNAAAFQERAGQLRQRLPAVRITMKGEPI